MPSVIKSVSFDAADALALARFWAAVFGSDVNEDSTTEKAFVEAAGWGGQHHAGLLPRADGTLRSSPGSQMKRRPEKRGDQQMPATLKLTHKAIGAEVRRGRYDVVVDGERAGSVEMNHTIEIPVEPGRHTLQVRNGRNSSSTQTFDAAEEATVAFRCTGKRLLPIFLASFAVPRLALKLVRE